MVSEKSLTAILTGPTATGKSALALEFALQSKKRGVPIEIINADSLLFYRGLDIGTAKPTPEERGRIPHHLIDIRDPNQAFTAGDFHEAAQVALSEVHARGHRAMVVGGSGFYLKALLHGIWEAPKADPALRKELEALSDSELLEELEREDPEALSKIHRSDRYRLVRALEILRLSGRRVSQLQKQVAKEPDSRFRVLILDLPNEELHARIARRTRQMSEAGLVDEYQRIHERFGSVAPLRAVGYAQVEAYLSGVKPQGRNIQEGMPGLIGEIELATRQLVKRQRTWFRNQLPEGTLWFHPEKDREKLRVILDSIYG